jgi:hypothetical protein
MKFRGEAGIFCCGRCAVALSDLPVTRTREVRTQLCVVASFGVGKKAAHGESTMTHPEETLRRWREICRVQQVYEQWREFFTALIGEPKAAEELCELGLKIVRGEMPPGSRIQDRVEKILRCTSSLDPVEASEEEA